MPTPTEQQVADAAAALTEARAAIDTAAKALDVELTDPDAPTMNQMLRQDGGAAGEEAAA